MPQCPVPKPVLKAPSALHNPPEPSQALAPAHETSPEAAMQSLAMLGKSPSLLPQTGKCSFLYTMGKEKQQETKRNINMKYAQLPLCMREGEEDGSGCLGASAGAEEPPGLQQGQREDSVGQTEGPFPSQGSDVEPVTTLEIISALAKAKETPCPRPQASLVEDSQRQIQLTLPAWKLG